MRPAHLQPLSQSHLTTPFPLSHLFSSATMASSSVCSSPFYQQFQALAGFPAARGLCSTVPSLAERDIPEAAQQLAVRDGPECPVGSDLCDVLAQLQALDPEARREAWYVVLSFFFLSFFGLEWIGVCGFLR